MKAHDEQESEHDVEQRREDEEIERCGGVAQRPDETRKQIIGYGEGYGQELKEEECVGIGEDGVGRIHHAQDGRTQQTGDRGHQQGDDYRQPQRVGHVAPHVGIVFGTEGLRHGNGETRAGSTGKPHDKEDDRRRSPYASQCTHADEATHDGSIDHHIHLLKDVSAHQRQCKAHDVARGRPYGHVIHISHDLSFAETISLLYSGCKGTTIF